MTTNKAKACLSMSAYMMSVAVTMTAVFASPSKASVDTTPVSIDGTNWGTITAPVFGTSQSGVYSGAELFAGPKMFDNNYYHGVLPNGRIVNPAGTSVQVGMNPLGSALTPDGRFLITSNDDERNGGVPSLTNPINSGGYSLTVVDTTTMAVVSQISIGKFFVGLQVTGTGPYTIWASGGADNDVKVVTMGSDGHVSGAVTSIPITPITSNHDGFVSNYSVGAPLTTSTALPTGFSTSGIHTTFPAGSALSPDGAYLYVACNGDNSLAVINTGTKTVVKQVPVGYFPYGVSVSHDGTRILVSNWGVEAYKFLPGYTYDATNKLTGLHSITPSSNASEVNSLFFVPVTDTAPGNPHTSSVSVLSAPRANGASAVLAGSLYEGKPLDDSYQVGDTHPSATATVKSGQVEVLYVAKANSDTLGLILVGNNRKLPDLDLSPINVNLTDGHPVHGSYPNALAVSPDNKRLYVAEASLNSVAVIDTTIPTAPKLIGRIPTGWYPTAISVSGDGTTLYVINAKGVGEDINPATALGTPSAPTGVESFSDSNYIFGSAQKISLSGTSTSSSDVLANNYHVNPRADTSIVPIGGSASNKINHVFFILHENKTFDSMLGNQGSHFGPFASTTFNLPDGSVSTDPQFTPVALNTQALADKFATAVNYYSDSEESDAGHQFAASGTATDYTEKTLLVKSGRGLLVNKNFEPEDYPEGGYIFNNASRNGVSFKDYGALIRIDGTDTGSSRPTSINDPASGNAGYPVSPSPLINIGDVYTHTTGLGQSYFMSTPILKTLGDNNPSGEPRLDRNYPGYNFNISDQRRAKEFITDFDRMVSAGTLPTFVYIYQPNDHTGGQQAANVPAASPAQQVNDGDVGLGMVVKHILSSPVYFNAATGQGSAIFVTYDDAQGTKDHIHQHRTPLLVISPYAKPGYVAKKHYSTASIVKTEELLLGLPPNNLGDLFATDLRDMFQADPNGIDPSTLTVTRTAKYIPSMEGKKIWALSAKLDTSAPDKDSHRLGMLVRMSMKADNLWYKAVKSHVTATASYKAAQSNLYQAALEVVKSPVKRDSDD